MSRSARFLVLASGVLFVLGAGAAGWLIMRRAVPQRAYVESSLGDVKLVYQPGYARFPAGRTGGRLDQLELATTFPGLDPAGDSTLSLTDPDAGKTRALVFLSIGRADRKVDPPDLVATLYARFLAPDIVETAEGLLKRNFQDGSPYAGEDLYFAPPEGRAFAARCARPTTPPDGLPETCIATFRQGPANGAVDVDLRFGRALLPQWDKLIEGARALTQSMLAR